MRSVDHVIRPPPIAERVFRRAPVRARPDPRGAAEPPASRRPLIDDLLQPHRRSLAELKAKAWGVAPLHAALAAGMVTERQIAAALATRLGAFLAEPHNLEGMLAAIDPADWQRTIARGYAPVVLAGGMKAVLLAPGAADAETIAANPQRLLNLGLPIIVGTPADLSDLVRRQCRREWVAEAVGGLARDRPEASANDRGLMRRTAWTAMVIVLLVSLALALGPGGLSGATGAFIGLIVLGWLGLRLVASVLPVRPATRHPLSDAELPVYSILCALHREETVVAGLIAALGRLTYPRARLDIQLILEADDPATLAAVRAANPPAHIRTLVLPPDGPRTKPKALMMALPLVRGDLLTVYDAEDRPDPGQLREAAETFAAGDERLGCLQAPLLIANPRDSLLTRFFAADYAAQFLVLLPALARLGLPIPLGGTSNHFRVGALRASGGWDPFNVTEDADLGFRLARAGWRIGTIRAPTWEEAPPRFRIWLGQRSRWFKGWLQTLAVLGRQPRQVAADLGIRGTLALMATLAGSLGLALVHPACIAGLAAALLAGHMPALGWRPGAGRGGRPCRRSAASCRGIAPVGPASHRGLPGDPAGLVVVDRHRGLARGLAAPPQPVSLGEDRPWPRLLRSAAGRTAAGGDDRARRPDHRPGRACRAGAEGKAAPCPRDGRSPAARAAGCARHGRRPSGDRRAGPVPAAGRGGACRQAPVGTLTLPPMPDCIRLSERRQAVILPDGPASGSRCMAGTIKPTVIVEDLAPHVALVRIERPEARNALDIPTRHALAEAFARLSVDPDVRVIVITGTGKAFAAGADLKDMAPRTSPEMIARRTHLHWQVIAQCPKPVIAAVNGFALGGGCELAMHADLILAAESAKFGQPEIKVGIMPGAGGTQRLVRAVGKFKAMKILLTGAIIDAAEADRIGLVTEVVPDAQLMDRARALAVELAMLPPIALAEIKDVVLHGEDLPLGAALALERKAFQLLFSTDDQKEGMGAFLDKRSPDFKGR